jgi:hypothetical protein
MRDVEVVVNLSDGGAQFYFVGRLHMCSHSHEHGGAHVGYRTLHEIDVTSSHPLHDPLCEHSPALLATMLSNLAKKCDPETSVTHPSHSILVVHILQRSKLIVEKLEATHTSLLGVDHTGRTKA